MERGRAAAIASIVVSWKMMNGATASERARAVRQARSAFESGDRSAGSTFWRAGADPRAPLQCGSDPGPTTSADALRGARPSRKRDLARRPSRPVGPARDVAHDSHR